MIKYSVPKGYKRVPGFNGICVTKSGKVFSQHCGRELKQCSTQYGHLLVGVVNKRTGHLSEYVHRLVAYAYGSNPTKKRNVVHKNFRPQDNRNSNLTWMTPRQQAKKVVRRRK